MSVFRVSRRFVSMLVALALATCIALLMELADCIADDGSSSTTVPAIEAFTAVPMYESCSIEFYTSTNLSLGCEGFEVLGEVLGHRIAVAPCIETPVEPGEGIVNASAIPTKNMLVEFVVVCRPRIKSLAIAVAMYGSLLALIAFLVQRFLGSSRLWTEDTLSLLASTATIALIFVPRPVAGSSPSTLLLALTIPTIWGRYRALLLCLAALIPSLVYSSTYTRFSTLLRMLGLKRLHRALLLVVQPLAVYMASLVIASISFIQLFYPQTLIKHAVIALTALLANIVFSIPALLISSCIASLAALEFRSAVAVVLASATSSISAAVAYTMRMRSWVWVLRGGSAMPFLTQILSFVMPLLATSIALVAGALLESLRRDF